MKIFKILNNKVISFLIFLFFTTTLYSHENNYDEIEIYLACECIKIVEYRNGNEIVSNDCYEKTTTIFIDLERRILRNIDWYETLEVIYIVPHNINAFVEKEYKNLKGRLVRRTTSYYLHNYTGKLKITYDVKGENIEDWSNTEYFLKCTPSKKFF